MRTFVVWSLSRPLSPLLLDSPVRSASRRPFWRAAPSSHGVLPERAVSGYEATLRVVVIHGKGETVLPRGIEIQRDGDTAKALAAAGFELPDQDGGAGARLSSIDLDAKSGRRQTTLELPLVALPKEPGATFSCCQPSRVDRARE